MAYIAPRYVPPPPLLERDLPADLIAVNANLGDGIYLIGYTTPGEPATAGGSLAVTLYWKALNAMDRDHTLALHLLGRRGEEVGKLDTWPGGGLLPTSQWATGAIYADPYSLPIAADAAGPTLLRLDLNFWDQDPAQHLPVTTADGETLSSLRLETGRLAQVLPLSYTSAQELLASFERGVTLVRYEAAADGALSLTLYWQLDEGAEPLPQYHVFRHLVSEAGVMVREPADSRPLGGDWPTTAWLPGHIVADDTVIALPPDLPPGRYNLRVGLYDPDTGERLPAYRPDDSRWPDDAAVIEGILQR
jgi:hypothetical protein